MEESESSNELARSDGHEIVQYSSGIVKRGLDLATQVTSAGAEHPSLVLERVLSGHKDVIRRVYFSSDGRLLVSGSDDRTIRLWDTKTCSEICSFAGHKGSVNGVVLSHDGKFILSASDDLTLRLWSVEPRKQVRVFRGHTDRPQNVHISPNNLEAYSGALDCSIRIWDISTGREIGLIRTNLDAFPRYAFSSNSKIALVCTFRGEASLWNLESATEECRFTNLYYGASAMSPDAQYGSFSAEFGWVVWDLKKRIQIGEVRGKYETGSDELGFIAHPNPFHNHWALSISPNNRYFVAGFGSLLTLWDLKTCVHHSSVRTEQGIVSSVAFSHDSKSVAVGLANGRICLLRIEG